MAVAADHFRLLLWARWKSYRNTLRKSSIQRAKFLTAILAWLLAIIGGGGSALAFVALGFDAARSGKLALVGLGAFLIFILWQLAPLLFEATSPTIKFRDIARYPIGFGTFYALHLAYGLLDPAVMLGLVWLLCLWIGLLIRNAGWALHAMLPFALFAAVNLLANRFLISLLDRVLSTRRGREAVLGTIMLLAVGAQITFYGVMPRFGSGGVKALGRSLLPVWNWSPPGLIAWSVAASPLRFTLALAALVAYCAVAAVLLRWQLRAVFAGEIYSESRRVSGAVQFRPGWSLPFLGEATSAIVEKELRYALRDSRTLMNMAMPIVFSIIIAISRGMASKVLQTGLHVQATSPRTQVLFSAGAVLVLAYLAYNAFGFDSGGFPRWVLLPACAKQVLVGKNMAVCLLWAATFVVVNLILFASGNATLAVLGPTLIGVLYGALVTLAVGNQFSVRTPLKLESGSIKSNNMTPGMMLGNMLVLATLAGSAWLAIALGRWLARTWITPLALLALASLAGIVYVLSLNNAAKYVEHNADRIAAELA